MPQNYRYFIFLILLCWACEKPAEPTGSETLFTLLPESQTNVDFENTIIENDTFNMVDFLYVYNGGGVAIGDLNNDGLPDIFFTGNRVNDRLYLNKGGMTFQDISEESGIGHHHGWSTGVTMVDINHDGYLDLYVCRSGNYLPTKRKNLLFINNGDLTFTESAQPWGIADTSYSTQAAFFDHDKDGDLDMYLLNHTNEVRDPNKIQPLIADGSGPANDKFYQNNGNGSFTDVTIEAGILHDGFGLGVAVADVDQDGWEDIYVSNDFLAQDYLYLNTRNGRFKESGTQSMKHFSQFGMGTDAADFNNDGWVDIIVADMLPSDNLGRKKMAGPLNFNLFELARRMGYHPQYMRNTLHLNQGKKPNGPLLFSEIGHLSGIYSTDWSWAPLFADFDNDGYKDIFITNGYLRDITDLDFINYTASLSSRASKQELDETLKNRAKEMPGLHTPNAIFKNSGHYTFEKKTGPWGLDLPSYSNGAAFGDLDNDGDLDLVVNNINEKAFIYRNNTTTSLGNHYLRVKLVGAEQNSQGLGSRVELYYKDTMQVGLQAVSRGYQSSVEPLLHFGLSHTTIIDSVVVTWPNRKTSKNFNVPADQVLVMDQTSAKSTPRLSTAKNTPLFSEVTQRYGLDFLHQDKFYLDFSRQYLLPHKHSQQGPGIAVADVNGDGLDDFFVGAGYEAVGQLFLQTTTGKFQSKPIAPGPGYEEDMGVLFFDADNDADKDLYIASGSNEFFPGSHYYQDRLYLNDGRGNFSLDTTRLPKMLTSSSCVRGADFDGDGDLDLFVGGRLSPLQYPFPGTSYLLINDKGKFTDQTQTLAPGLKNIGMVTDALWTDIDNDFDADLLIVGEFMGIQVYKNEEGKLVNISSQIGLQNTSGWWKSIAGADFDNDGDIDYVAGNLGGNSRYKVSPEEPLTVYSADYDGNGHIDPILTYYLNGTEYPTHSRDDLIRQIPAMKKQYPDYLSYAQAEFSQLFTGSVEKRAFIKQAHLFETIYLENLGNMKFKVKKLPIEAQFAPVYGILIDDFNADGFLDLLLSGNDYGTEVTIGQYDASIGLLLTGDGKGGFQPSRAAENGLYIDGDVKGVASIMVGDQLVYLFALNNDRLVAYQSQNPAYSFATIGDSILKANVVYKDRTVQVQEFYHGSSHLSQSSRRLKIPGETSEIFLFDYAGHETRYLDLNYK